MTLEEALKEIEILKLQNKKMGETFDSLDKKYDSLKLELELAQACHKEKCAEFNKLCFDYAKLQVRKIRTEYKKRSRNRKEKRNRRVCGEIKNNYFGEGNARKGLYGRRTCFASRSRCGRGIRINR